MSFHRQFRTTGDLTAPGSDDIRLGRSGRGRKSDCLFNLCEIGSTRRQHQWNREHECWQQDAHQGDLDQRTHSSKSTAPATGCHERCCHQSSSPNFDDRRSSRPKRCVWCGAPQHSFIGGRANNSTSGCGLRKSLNTLLNRRNRTFCCLQSLHRLIPVMGNHCRSD